MRNTHHRNLSHSLFSRALGMFLAVAAMSFAPIWQHGKIVDHQIRIVNTDTTIINPVFRMVDVASRITESCRCHFFLRDGDVLFIDPGYAQVSQLPDPELTRQLPHYPGLVLSENITQLINTNNLNHE